jgi:hypothetical protein
MTAQEFDNLSLGEKIGICRYGHFIDAIQYYGYDVHLYSLDDGSFVEMFCSRVEEQVELVSLCDDGDLNKFLSRIKFSSWPPFH